MVSTVQDDGSGDFNPLESVPLVLGDGGTLEASLAHFSTDVLFGPLPAGATLSQVCATDLARGLSNLILTEFENIAQVNLIDISSSSVDCRRCEHALLQKPAADDLQDAVDIAKPTSMPIHINSAWRSVADQYVLKRPCANPNNNAVARLGQSQHMSGNAVDVQNPGVYLKDACNKLFTDATATGNEPPTAQEVLDKIHPAWAGPLTASHFAWLGLNGTDQKSICSDPPHFTNTTVSTDYRAINIQAFQNLWNKYRPCNPIPEGELEVVADTATSGGEVSEDSIPETISRLGQTPASGFAPSDANPPGSSGMPGLGCPLDTDPNATVCCPGSGGAAPSCQPSCQLCPAGQTWNPNAQPPACECPPGQTWNDAIHQCASCAPTTCAARGANCGAIPDGCGGTWNCGSCTAPETCGGGGFPNQCGWGIDVLLVLDPSDPSLTAALNTILSSTASIRWGLKLDTTPPGSTICGLSAGVEVPIGASSALAIATVIANVVPGKNTPTASAVRAVTAYLKTVVDTSRKVILLATDGTPDCISGGSSSTIDAITAAAGAGFSVYVIGSGPSVGNLNSFAQAGGTATYYPAASPGDLANALASLSQTGP
jgi:hypothetical protein